MEKNKGLINEIFILRSIACLSILLLHVFDRVYMHQNGAVNNMSVLLTFGTPAFIFISEFIIAYSYRNREIKSFWGNRIKYIFLPYLFFGAFYAAAKAFGETVATGSFTGVFGEYLWKHILLGDYHGYFILIIFQFYALHVVFNHYLKQASPRKIIGFSFLITALYLAFFNFVPPMNLPFADYIWSKYYWVPFPGWVFYFSLAFYSGHYYESFQRLLAKYRHWTTVSVIVTGVLPIMLYQMGILPTPSSKRIDMMLFTISMIFFIYSHAMLLSKVPRFFVLVSKYSFGIYLFHPFFLGIAASFYFLWQDIHPLLMVPILFFLTIALCASTIYIFNKLPFGAYMVGKVGISSKDKVADPVKKAKVPAAKAH
ncbi:acyltransferase family protein [Domibacillus robiginosus]|uniref:acyltransferase family protein n=1 Tax=Domibacillus robiginosus TaxID=1071054 RepID=UPI00067C9145|nr:acyltransferase family protein [Domibacillus robiginosus]